ncbi:MAG: carboxypeptidase regulatory-like domain-containing protein [Gemmatimonadales bacterium]
MNRTLLLSLLALTVAPVAGRAQARDITGTVRRADTGAPLAGVLVSVVGRTNGVCTDDNGRYRLPDVEGALQVRARVDGFNPGLAIIAADASSADLRMDRTSAAAPRADGALVYIDGIPVSETSEPRVTPRSMEPLVYIDGIRVSWQGC